MKTAKTILIATAVAVGAGAQTRPAAINIINTPAQPVWHAKAIKKQPFQFSTTLSFGLNAIDSQKFFVPPGKLLVLERVTLEGYCAGVSQPMVTMVATFKGNAVKHPMVVDVSADSHYERWTVFAETLGTAIADPNSAVYVQVDGSNSKPTNAGITYTGFLIDAN